MIVYEVSLEVDHAVLAPYLAWLRGHMAQILTLPGFVDAQLYERRDVAADAPRHSLVVAYRLQDEAALENYFAHHAAAMRADGQARFPQQFSATRRVLREL